MNYTVHYIRQDAHGIVTGNLIVEVNNSIHTGIKYFHYRKNLNPSNIFDTNKSKGSLAFFCTLEEMRNFLLLFALTVPPAVQSFSPLHSPAIISHNVKWSSRFNPKLVRVDSKSTPVLFAEKVFIDATLQKGDELLLTRLVRIASHAPTLATLLYFGLVSMTSMMGGPGPIMPTLSSVLTKALGSTTSAEFSGFFPTLITPPSYIFAIWPLISLVQLLTIAISALRPSPSPLLAGADLSSLSIANLAATSWLFVSSKAAKTMLPLSAFLILPVVPIFAGFPLRTRSSGAMKASFDNVAFQLFSSFTTIAAFLALTVELQHGGRLAFFKGKAELSAIIFLSLYYYLVGLGGQGIVKKSVNVVAIVGILLKRLNAGLMTGSAGVGQLFLSVSFIGTCAVAFKALKKLFEKTPE